MPLVQIKGISGYLSLQQKQEIISKVTDAIVFGNYSCIA
jgi:4-oxalocrotonate tautomerase